MDIDIKNAQLNLLLSIDGKVHLVGMDEEKLEVIDLLVKKSASIVIPTSKTQEDLLEFLNYKKNY
ncbi:hypothetical protein MHI57_09760 [Cytobacillus sp. FSL K6-0129]|uniref:hypothetical protein n=1 Tax=Cytobacillus sp. FSL K6-0129 TaxID=2921421 RepID=UPI0030FAF5C1